MALHPLSRIAITTLIAGTGLLNLALADSAQAKRIAKANYQYCIQESLANPYYCDCISKVYEENLGDANLSKTEENFVIKVLSGKLALDALGPQELALSELVTQKIDAAQFESSFTQCFGYLEESFEPSTTQPDTISQDQQKAIEEAEAIEEIEGEEGI